MSQLFHVYFTAPVPDLYFSFDTLNNILAEGFVNIASDDVVSKNYLQSGFGL